MGHYVLSISAVYSLVLRFVHWQEMFVYGYCDEFLNKLYFSMIFVGVDVTFFPIHQMGILRIPRRYFSYGELYMTLNIVTFIRTLFTILRWVVLIVILYNVAGMSLGIGGYVRYIESLYGLNTPHHTFMDG